MINCPKCGKELGDSTEQCYFCGAYIHEDSEKKIAKEKRDRNKRKYQLREVRNTKEIVGGFFLGLFLSVLSLFFVLMIIRRRDVTYGAIIGIIVQAALGFLSTIVYWILAISFS